MESVDVKAERLKEKYIGFLMDSFRARATEVNFDANPLAVMPALEPSSAVEPLPTEVYVPKRDKHIRFTFSIVKQEKNPELERRRSELSSSVSQLPAPEKTLLLEKLDALINKEIKQESEFDIWDEDKASIPFWPLVQKAALLAKYRLMDEYFPVSFPVTVLSLRDVEGAVEGRSLTVSAGASYAEFLETLNSLHQPPTFTPDDPRILESQLRRLQVIFDRAGREDDLHAARELKQLCQDRVGGPRSRSTVWMYVNGAPESDEPMNTMVRNMLEAEYGDIRATAKKSSITGFTFIQAWQMELRDFSVWITRLECRSDWHNIEFMCPPSASAFELPVYDGLAYTSGHRLPELNTAARYVQSLQYLGRAAEASPELAAEMDSFFEELGLAERINAEDSGDAEAENAGVFDGQAG